jgi:hypothetical protein
MNGKIKYWDDGIPKVFGTKGRKLKNQPVPLPAVGKL